MPIVMCVEGERESANHDERGEEDLVHTAGIIRDDRNESDASLDRFDTLTSPFVIANADSMPDKCAARYDLGTDFPRLSISAGGDLDGKRRQFCHFFRARCRVG